MRVVLAYLVCALVWGTTWFAIRVCIGEDGYPTFPAAAIRFTIAAVILLALVVLSGARPLPAGRREWGGLLLAGLLNALGYALVYVGEETVSGGIAAVVYGTQPLLLALLVTVTGTERVTRWDILGALVGMGGIVVIFFDRMDVSAHQAYGVALILGSVVVATTYTFAVKRTAARIHPLASATVFLTVTAIALWVVTWVADGNPIPSTPRSEATLALLYLSVFGSVVAFTTYFWILQRITLMTSTTLVFVIPIIALFVDALWEEEVRLGLRGYLGIFVTLLGVGTAVLGKAVPQRRARRLADRLAQ